MASSSVFAELMRSNKLDGSNFTVWKRKLNFLLTTENIDYVVSVAEPDEPAEDASEEEKENYREELNDWTRDNKKARVYMLGSMEDSLAGEYESEKAAYKILRRLEEDFGEVSLIKVLSLVNRFISSKMAENTSVSEHLNKLCVLVEDLKNAGYPFQEEVTVMVALNSLPSSWEQFKISFCHTERSLNMRTLRHHLLMEEDRKNNMHASQFTDYAEEAQILKDDSGQATSPCFKATSETAESRLQEVNKDLEDNKEKSAGNHIFNGPRKRKVKGIAMDKDILIKLLCAERRSRLLLFSLSQVVKFTENFRLDNVVGCGAFGYVYKGKLPSGTEIAVKRLAASSTQGLEEFTAEIETIANLQHRNVIRLLGFCIQREKDFLGFRIQREEMILVYEYMPNKSLASFLYSYGKTGESLNWCKRLHIIEGIAQGLVYLHELSHQCVVHMDLKANNILLDYEMNPKISDFGMARILPSSGTEETSDTVKGTTGYMDPEYIRSGKFSVKSDVYSFGIMILEIVSRKRRISLLSNGDMMNLPTVAWELWKAGKSHELLDISPVCNEPQTAQIIKFIHVALLCIQDCPMHRPTMSDVLLMLRSESVCLPTPSVPVNRTNGYLADALTLDRLREVNLPLQPSSGNNQLG